MVNQFGVIKMTLNHRTDLQMMISQDLLDLVDKKYPRCSRSYSNDVIIVSVYDTKPPYVSSQQDNFDIRILHHKLIIKVYSSNSFVDGIFHFADPKFPQNVYKHLDLA